MAKMTISDKIKAAFGAKAKLDTDLRADFEAIDLEILTAQNRLADLNRAPVPREEIARRVDMWLAVKEAQGNVATIPAMFALQDFEPVRINVDVAYSSPFNGFSAFVALVGPAAIRDRLIDAAVQALPGEPLTAADRERETKRLTAEIDKLERTRESIAREADKLGLSLPRSEYADPAVLLALDEDL